MSRLAVLILALFLCSYAVLSGSATTITIGEIFSETEVTASLMINDVTNLATGGVEITYDPSVIRITGAQKGDLSNFIVNLERADAGWVKLGAYQVGEGLSGNIKLAELTIAPQGSYGAISDLDVELKELYDNEQNTIDAAVLDGFFYIGMNGDVNADRVINNDDSLYIANGIAGVAGYELKAGASEVSGDGIVDAYDCVYLARHAAGIAGYEVLQ
jgi:hypothetical protein